MSHLKVSESLGLKQRLQRSQLYHAAMAYDLEEALALINGLESQVTKYHSDLQALNERIVKLVAANEKAHTEHTTLSQLNEELKKKLQWTEQKLAEATVIKQETQSVEIRDD
jgi:septation ring formation regulator EzrA